MMIDFETFTEIAKERIADYLPDADIEDVEIRKSLKTNREYTGMSILRKGENISPNLILEKFYGNYLISGDINAVLGEIAEAYKESYENIPPSLPDFENPDYIKSNVFIALVNRDINEKLISEGPFMEPEGLDDIVGIYKVMVNADENGMSSFRLVDSMVERVGLTIGDIEQAALENTKRMFPAKVMSMGSAIMSSIGEENLPDDFVPPDECGMYVITDEIMSNGAVTILDKDVISNLAEKLGENLILLPSSTHEFLAVADDGSISVEDAADMVCEVNRGAVHPSERLSDNVFYFDRKTQEFSQLTHREIRLDEEMNLPSRKVM